MMLVKIMNYENMSILSPESFCIGFHTNLGQKASYPKGCSRAMDALAKETNLSKYF